MNMYSEIRSLYLQVATQRSDIVSVSPEAKSTTFCHGEPQIDDHTTWCDCLTHAKDSSSTSRRLPLHLTCHQIYSESVSILWSQNPIHLQCAPGFRDPLSSPIHHPAPHLAHDPVTGNLILACRTYSAVHSNI
ncbi:hypothetical protein BDW59DRAFT_143611 [Aspergillus cavernicola]|uniref:DUF7730 domain-containing protein n=1 Tax=Aspergillus cavernicola TaxID=176166 RepID=A0ABR4IJM6_9EURO